MRLFCLILLTSLSLFGKSVTLSWTDNSNPPGTTYSIYRADGACSASLTLFNKVSSEINIKTFTEEVTIPGNYCYRVTANYNGLESVPSNSVTATIPLAAPDALIVVVK